MAATRTDARRDNEPPTGPNAGPSADAPPPSDPPTTAPRRGGRGARPFFLIPKVLAVGVYFGSVCAAAAVYFIWVAAQEPGSALRREGYELLRLIIVFVSLPALGVAAATGLALFLPIRSVMARQRWWRLKMALLAAGVPALHVWMAATLHRLRHAEAPRPALDALLGAGFVVLILGSAAVIALSRHKPRLGQNWARAYPRPAPAKPLE